MLIQTKKRCTWLDTSKVDYVQYHDEEWGVPIYDDRALFECLCLESAQAGLSWYTILKRRNSYRQAFANFEVDKIALFDQSKVDDLMDNHNIIRHRGKINSVINNAKKTIEIQNQLGSLSHYIWGFVEGRPIVLSPSQLNQQPTTNPNSDLLSKDLKKRGFQFVGPKICFAYMQACGMINGHDVNCFGRHQINV